MSFVIKRALASVGAFVAGYGTLHSTKDNSSMFVARSEKEQKLKYLHQIKVSKEYNAVASDPNFNGAAYSSTIPISYRQNHVGQGLLYGQDYFEIDPLVFLNKKDGMLIGFYRIGSKLTNSSGKLHHGVLGLMLDEGLCFCGFPQLPHKRGVTGKLAIDYVKEAPVNANVVLRAKVTEAKGRKVVIDGEIAVLDGEVLAKAHCVLVEPKWFKYFGWLELFRN